MRQLSIPSRESFADTALRSRRSDGERGVQCTNMTRAAVGDPAFGRDDRARIADYVRITIRERTDGEQITPYRIRWLLVFCAQRGKPPLWRDVRGDRLVTGDGRPMGAWRKSHRAPSLKSQILTSGARLNKRATGVLRNEPKGDWPFKLQISNPKSERGRDLRNEPKGVALKLQISNPKSERGRGRCQLRIAKRTQRDAP